MLGLRCRRGVAAFVAIVGVASAAFAGGPPPGPEFEVNIRFQAGAIKYSPGFNTPYLTYPSLSVSGFTDEGNAANSARVFSLNDAFEGDDDGNSTSTFFAGVQNLKNALSDDDGWMLEITDGATSAVYSYFFTVNADNLLSDYIRPITFTNVSPGDMISANPTFNWSQANTAIPQAMYNGVSIDISNSNFSIIYNTPSITDNDRQWTPDGPLVPEVYNLTIGKFNNATAQDLITASIPQPADQGTPELSFFSTNNSSFSIAQVRNLRVVPPPCPGDANGNGTVDFVDVISVLANFGTSYAPGTGLGDSNRDGVVNFLDIINTLANFNATCR